MDINRSELAVVYYTTTIFWGPREPLETSEIRWYPVELPPNRLPVEPSVRRWFPLAHQCSAVGAAIGQCRALPISRLLPPRVLLAFLGLGLDLGVDQSPSPADRLARLSAWQARLLA
jgi:hypothetical protein